MSAVRRVLATAGVLAVLLTPATAAWADPTPSADPSATASATASPDPGASPTPTPTDGPEPSPEPTGSGCEQNPEICQSGGAPGSDVDCGQVTDGGPAASPPPDGVVCIASGLNPGNPTEVSESTAGSGAGRLPRTGPAPLLPTSALGAGLLLIGLVAALTGRRRTARI